MIDENLVIDSRPADPHYYSDASVRQRIGYPRVNCVLIDQDPTVDVLSQAFEVVGRYRDRPNQGLIDALTSYKGVDPDKVGIVLFPKDRLNEKTLSGECVAERKEAYAILGIFPIPRHKIELIRTGRLSMNEEVIFVPREGIDGLDWIL